MHDVNEIVTNPDVLDADGVAAEIATVRHEHDLTHKGKEAPREICDSCGERISKARLAALKSVRYCITCQESIETGKPSKKKDEKIGEDDED